MQKHILVICKVTKVCRISDLVGELQEMQSATNTSTAADLLKQGAGTTLTIGVKA